MIDRTNDLEALHAELHGKKVEHNQQFQQLANDQMDQLGLDIRNKCEDDMQADQEQLRLVSQTKLRQKKECIYDELQIQEQRVRQKWASELELERNNQEMYHKMDLQQVEMDTQ